MGPIMPLTIFGTAACSSCKFFDAEDGNTALGLCRHNPPISQPTGETAGMWPKVNAMHWCGHFEPATT